MDNEEMEELFGPLRAAGWNPRMMDRSVVHYDNSVAQELQRMAVLSFDKPVRLWDENDAPVRGKRFRDYVMIADRTEELLMAA